ncbi:hypothetical protein BDB00DRAFT_871576 [Zychaea mexicana]|uniref:uncharacterized protein n=1 Tax=Zychaea mexicana TaxID=64656 RepID=UPI0022FEF64A|nr:uncharacterized protein BDB00DRAFT_871576 [Zychaea mexicana]KAI9494250.1 hypothetical protein BDB00DRAFT_871576 [Zychaea mexicana]
MATAVEARPCPPSSLMGLLGIFGTMKRQIFGPCYDPYHNSTTIRDVVHSSVSGLSTLHISRHHTLTECEKAERFIRGVAENYRLAVEEEDSRWGLVDEKDLEVSFLAPMPSPEAKRTHIIFREVPTPPAVPVGVITITSIHALIAIFFMTQ